MYTQGGIKSRFDNECNVLCNRINIYLHTSFSEVEENYQGPGILWGEPRLHMLSAFQCYMQKSGRLGGPGYEATLGQGEGEGERRNNWTNGVPWQPEGVGGRGECTHGKHYLTFMFSTSHLTTL